MRVLVLLFYYSNFSVSNAMNPTADVYEKIINDLHQTILLQSTIIDDNLLMEIDIDEDLVQVYRDSEPCRWDIFDFSKIYYLL